MAVPMAEVYVYAVYVPQWTWVLTIIISSTKLMCSIHYMAYLQTNLKYNHTWAIQWMQHWSSNANGSSICIPIDLSTDDTFKVPISTVSCVGGYLIIPWWQWVNTICGHLVFLYGHYITIFSIVAETKFPSFQFCLVLRCASKLCIIINVS